MSRPNRAHWDALADSYAVHARRHRAQTEPTWGNFAAPQSLFMLCEPDVEPVTDRLLRPQAGLHRMSWESDPGWSSISATATGSGRCGERGSRSRTMIELFAPEDAQSDCDIVTLEWARRWPVEGVWFARRRP